MSYEVYAVVYGDAVVCGDPLEVWSLYASREMAEKDIKQHGGLLTIEPMKVWEESDRIAEELVKE